MNRALYALPVVALVLLVAMFYAGLSGPPPSLLPSPLAGKPAPDFKLAGLSGNGFSRADLAAGHYTILNFWASWCAPCRVEHPLLAALAAQKGVALYGIAWKNKPGEARAYLAELGNPYVATDSDESGRAGIDFGIAGVPETFVIDGHGVIRARYPGPLTEDVIETVILPALKGAS